MRTVLLSLATCTISLLVTALGSPSYAEEARCAALGGNCVCSEPFNTTSLVATQQYWKDPADSLVKECSTTGIEGAALESNTISKIVSRNDASMMSALPAAGRAAIQSVVGGTNNHLGIFFAGHTHKSSTYTKRLAARFYIYHSPDFQFAQEGVCTNSKLMQFTGPNSLLDKSFGSVHMYNFTNFSPAQDCCFNGPGPDQSAISKASWRGKWWRVEAVYTNRAGPGWRMQVFFKNVTDNGPELTVVDTSASGTQLNNVSRTPPQRQDAMLMNNYRETGCNGWLAFSHYMMAGWDTDSGQRIGSALEIEGVSGATGSSGGTTPVRPPAPVMQ
jgi:hypothetical protein